jgi:hypothetical protein
MTDDDKRPSEAEADIEREIRLARKLTAKDLLAHMAGPGALRVVLHRHLRGSDMLLNNLDHPLVALADYCRRLVAADYLLKDIVSEADIEWARAMDERPHFEREGAPPDPDDPYTLEGVRGALHDALQHLTESHG